MSKYTTQVRFICETEAGLIESKGFNNVEEIITTAAPKVFNFDFPIWDESYRLVLEKKILRHYYTREICAETVGLWKLWLNDKLNMIMPYYNKLYESTVLQFNPLYDTDITTNRTVENEGTTTGNTTLNEQTGNTGNRSRNTHVEGETSDAYDENRHNEGESERNENDWQLFSDTPQGGITGVVNASIIQNSSLADYAYLTTAENDKSTVNETHEDDNTTHGTRAGTSENTGTETETTGNSGTRAQMGTSQGAISNTEEYIEHVSGKRGVHTYSAMIMEFRKTIINIDAMIIDELNDLFFGLWD